MVQSNAYHHDITNQSRDIATLRIWKVEGKTYVTTTLMTNVTSGTVDFLGSGLLAHSAPSDPYTVVFSADHLARRATPATQLTVSEGQGMCSMKQEFSPSFYVVLHAAPSLDQTFK